VLLPVDRRNDNCTGVDNAYEKVQEQQQKAACETIGIGSYVPTTGGFGELYGHGDVYCSKKVNSMLSVEVSIDAPWVSPGYNALVFVDHVHARTSVAQIPYQQGFCWFGEAKGGWGDGAATGSQYDPFIICAL